MAVKVQSFASDRGTLYKRPIDAFADDIVNIFNEEEERGGYDFDFDLEKAKYIIHSRDKIRQIFDKFDVVEREFREGKN